MLPDNNILDILISLVLIYALLSILVSILVEWWNSYRKTRSLFLRKVIYQLLEDPLNIHFGALFYQHYMIEGLYDEQRKKSPQYISSKMFSEVLIDIIANRKLHDQPITLTGQSGALGKQYELDQNHQRLSVMDRFEKGLDSLKPSPFTDTLRSFLDKSKDMDDPQGTAPNKKSYDNLKGLLSFWYDDYMDRMSGRYKEQQRFNFRAFGFIVAIALNVDSIHLVKILSLNDNLRNKLVTTAERVATNYEALSDSARQNNTELLRAFHQAIPDSVINDTTKTKIKHLGNLAEKEIPSLKKIINVNDSLNALYIVKADSVLGIASALDLPIGWDPESAPLSWSNKKTSPPEGDGILAYTFRRNQGGKNIPVYLLGVFISGIALSFGAPFWFETLVKLINIRRTGKRPEQVNESSK